MSRYVFKLPDLGEGTIDAEIVAWRVAVGDEVREDQPLVEVLTQKATIEVPAPVAGRVVSTTGTAGDRVAVGAELAVFETDTAAPARQPDPQPVEQPAEQSAEQPVEPPPPQPALQPARDTIRRRHLARHPASGPRGGHRPDDAGRQWPRGPHHLERSGRTAQGWHRPVAVAAGQAPDVQEIPVIGLRRVIAEQVSHSAHTIPHFSYVEEVDVTELAVAARRS